MFRSENFFITWEKVLIGLSLLVLILPRSLYSAPLIFGIPVLAYCLLYLVGPYKLQKNKVLVLVIALLINFIVVLLSESYISNFVLSMATYGCFILPVFSRTEKSKMILFWWCRIFFIICFLVVLTVCYQLFIVEGYLITSNLFNIDALGHYYGSGGAKLVPLILFPGFFMAGGIFLMREVFDFKFLGFSLVFLLAALIQNTHSLNLVALTSVVITGLIFCVKFLITNKISIELFLVRTSIFVISCFLVTYPLTGSILKLGHMETRLADVSQRVVSFVNKAILKQPWSMNGDFTENPAGQGKTENSNEQRKPEKEITPHKVSGWKHVIITLPRVIPYQPLVGIGLGNYASWSQLISSPVYLRRYILGKHVSFSPKKLLPSGVRPVTNRLIFEPIKRSPRLHTGSVVDQPWSSWLAIYAELGFMGILVTGFLLGNYFKTFFVHPRFESRYIKGIFLGLILSLVFLVIAGFVDVYFEYPWLTVPIFSGWISLKSVMIDKKGKYA